MGRMTSVAALFLSSAINFATMSQGHKEDFVLCNVRAVDHTVISDAETKLRTALKAFVRKVRKMSSDVTNFFEYSDANTGRQAVEYPLEFGRVNFGRLAHDQYYGF